MRAHTKGSNYILRLLGERTKGSVPSAPAATHNDDRESLAHSHPLEKYGIPALSVSEQSRGKGFKGRESSKNFHGKNYLK